MSETPKDTSSKMVDWPTCDRCRILRDALEACLRVAKAWRADCTEKQSADYDAADMEVKRIENVLKETTSCKQHYPC